MDEIKLDNDLVFEEGDSYKREASERTRRRIFQLLEKIYLKEKESVHPFRFYINLLRTFIYAFKRNDKPSRIEEVKELIEIFVNKNPYIEDDVLEIVYADKLGNDAGRADAMYSPGEIKFSEKFLNRISYSKGVLCEIVDTIGHERQHHKQHKAADLQEQEARKQFPGRILPDYNKGYLTKEAGFRLIGFVNENAKNKKEEISLSKGEKVHHGAYLVRAHEADARGAGFDYAIDIMNCIRNDEFCSRKLERRLGKLLELFKRRNERYKKYNRQCMNEYMRLYSRLKELFAQFIRSDNESEEVFNYKESVLNIAWSEISVGMSASEKIEYYNWAKRHNNPVFLQRVISDMRQWEGYSLKEQQEYIQFVLKESKQVIDIVCASEFLSLIFDIVRNTSVEEEVITEFLCNLIHNGQIFILSKMVVMGANYDKHKIESEIIEYITNEISSAEKSGEIKKITLIHNFLRKDIYENGFSQEFYDNAIMLLGQVEILLERNKTNDSEIAQIIDSIRSDIESGENPQSSALDEDENDGE